MLKLQLSTYTVALALVVPAHAGEYDPVDPQTWPDVPGYEQVVVPNYVCNSNDKSECEKAYLYACQDRGQDRACDYYNATYARTNEYIKPNPAQKETSEEQTLAQINLSIAASVDEQQKLIIACGNGNQKACSAMTVITEEQKATQACLQGDQAMCERMGLEPGDPKAVAACAAGDQRICAELGIERANQQVVNACANGNQQACADLGIDPKQQALATACMQGNQTACTEMGLDEQYVRRVQNVANAVGEKNEEKNGACEIVMCVSSGMKTLPHQCVKNVKKFFSIRKTHHGHFSPDRTARARADKLKKCDGASKKDIAAIISAFGGLPTNPFKFTLD